MGGKASGIERARRAYMKQSAREIILKMHYFYEAEEELEAEWKEFQRWRRRKKKRMQPKRRSPQEQKVIDDAKAILMENNNMTEPEAFRYIQKCSMDSGNTMVESASMVIGIYSE